MNPKNGRFLNIGLEALQLKPFLYFILVSP